MRYCRNDPTHPLDANASPLRLFCSTACRVASHRKGIRAADAQFRLDAADLLRRQTAAVIAGDLDALAVIARDAERLFGPTA